MSIVSVPKIYRMGERWTFGILNGNVVIEEKYDGSQFTFGVINDKLVCRSKGAILDGIEPTMFEPAINVAHELHRRGMLGEGQIHFCEFLARPKHNVLTYGRAPKNFLVLYDVFSGPASLVPNRWMTPGGKIEYANILGLEPVKVIYSGVDAGVPHKFLETESSLGGCKVEGVVIKNYQKPHGERGEAWPMTAKIVSDRFKEKMACRPMNPKAGPGEFVQSLINSLRTEARWLKAVQHLKEAGKLQGANSDIGPLCKEVQSDILSEETDWIKQKLFDEFSKEIIKGSVHGFAQWYQDKLANGWSVFEETKIFNRPDKCTCEGSLPFPICECGAKENDL
jgi:hypothetical protein